MFDDLFKTYLSKSEGKNIFDNQLGFKYELKKIFCHQSVTSLVLDSFKITDEEMPFIP